MTAAVKLRHLLFGREALAHPDNIFKSITFLTKVCIVKTVVFPVELDYKEGRVLMNWCFWIVVLKTLESPLDSKAIKPVNPKRNQPWIFIGRTDAETEAPVLWPPGVKNSLEKTQMLGKTECKRRRGQQRMRWLDGINEPTQWTWVWANSRRCW